MRPVQPGSGLAVRPVQPLSTTPDGSRVPSHRRGVKIEAELSTWAWLIEHAYASPGIVFEALADSWMITAELVGADLEFRHYRLR